MAVITTRHRTVATRLDEPTHPTPMFLVHADEGEDRHGVMIHVPADVDEDMGSPVVVTVTVEPGDLLNELPEHYEPLLGTATVEQLLNELHDRLSDVGSDEVQAITQLLAELPTEVLSLRTEGTP